jgi:chromosome segregation ATPase
MLAQKGGVPGGRIRRKKQRIGANGEMIEESEDEDAEDDPEAVEAYLSERRRELDARRDEIMNNKSLIAEEKQRLLQELQSRETDLEKQRHEQQDLQDQIRVMESKVSSCMD